MTAPNDILTADEVAQTLRVTAATIYRWAATGALDSIRVGGTVRFRRADIDAILNAETGDAKAAS